MYIFDVDEVVIKHFNHATSMIEAVVHRRNTQIHQKDKRSKVEEVH